LTHFASGQTLVTDPLRRPVAAYLLLVAVPLNLGITVPWTLSMATVLTLGVGAFVGMVALLACSHTLALLVSRHHRSGPPDRKEDWASRHRRWNASFPALLLLVICLIYWRSPISAVLVFAPYWSANGRYILPATVPLTLMVSGFFAQLRALKSRSKALVSAVTPSGPQNAKTVYGSSLFALFLCALLVGYAIPYLASDGEQVMQSPYASASIFVPTQTFPAPLLTFPATDNEMLRYLERAHIHYMWASHWIGNVVMYLENQRILCADNVDVAVWRGSSRFPHPADLVASADPPASSFVTIRRTASQMWPARSTRST
jgi:hypothetical protein